MLFFASEINQIIEPVSVSVSASVYWSHAYLLNGEEEEKTEYEKSQHLCCWFYRILVRLTYDILRIKNNLLSRTHRQNK